MESNFNFMDFGNDPLAEGGGDGRPSVDFPLSRQSSIFSLTFSEFQSAIGGRNKEFGSMNMDELLKNLWSAEERQILGSTSGGQRGNNIQRQGSLTLPRTLSQRTVDEVWRDVFKVYGGEKEVSGGAGDISVPRRQPTLGEVTLEEFLVMAGVVREETDLASKREDGGFHSLDPISLGLEFGYQVVNKEGYKISKGTDHVVALSAKLPLNVDGVRSTLREPVHKQQLLLPKHSELVHGDPKRIPHNHLGHIATRGEVSGLSGLLIHGRGLETGSLAVQSEVLAKCNDDMSAISPDPCMLNSGLRGSKQAPLEKVVERRQRRMIKNRESAARSRARKQAYTLELEAEIAKLKEENDELRRKQAEMMELQENGTLEMIMQEKGLKRRRLRRTQTSPW